MTQEQSQLIQNWIEDAKILLKCYLSEADKLRRRHRIIGIVSAVLSGIVGSSIFASLGKQELNPELVILVGLTSLSATILASIMAFLKLPEIANQCHNSGNQYAEIRKELELLATFNENKNMESEIKRIEAKWNNIRNSSTPVSDKKMKKFKRKL
ncbi:SLATT domain-containing protein [Fluviicola sp.]|uniref:SLATT domain-containing protein n=1 Tax=Fluviicola sp. TaxID=1917219 RepID=UPI0031DED862